MGFLDNLENNIKAVESREEIDPEKRKREIEAREAARAEALRRAPYAEALKAGPYTEQLLTACRTIGHGKRVLVQFTWIDSTLRLDARQKRLELQPTAEGVHAVFYEDGQQKGSETVDLNGDADALARRWLEG